MLNSETKRHIDKARDVLVGVAPSPMTQVDLITTALIYKFMDDMDQQSIKLGGKPSFFVGGIEKYSWSKLMDPKLDNQGKVNLYQEALTKLPEASNLPSLFREIFKDTFLPFRNVNTFKLFIDEIDYFDYSHPEELGNAFEYLLTILGVSGDAGMFRTPRHIIDFIVKVVDPNKDDRILDPACGTAGFLIQAYKHIISKHDELNDPEGKEEPLTTDEIKNLTNNIEGYDISPEMVKLSSVNLYLHDFKNPKISEYDTLSSDEKWNERFDVILANPPFMTPRGGIIPHNRFSIQATKSEVLFVDYILTHLKHSGRAGIVVPEGIIFQSGNAYKELRKKLLNEGLFGVVSLPSGVFNPYSGVKTSILLIDKDFAKKQDEILFIKISNDGYDLGAQRKEINKNDLPEALEVINNWKKGKKIESRLSNHVSKKAILDSLDFNLNADRYIINHKELESNYPSLLLKELEDQGLINIGRGKVISREDLQITPGIYPVYSSSAQGIGEFGQYGLYMFDDELISWSVDGGGKFFHRPKHKFSLTNVSGWIKVLDLNKLNVKFLYYILNQQWETKTFDYVAKAHPSVIRELYNIPLPPIETQEQIVEELDRYQNIIEGAKLITENWKPRIEIDSKWKKVNLGEICSFEYGEAMPEKNRIKGTYPVVGSNGVIGTHNEYLIEGPSIIVGRKGSAGEVNWINDNSFPIDTTYFVKIKNKEVIELKFFYYALLGLGLKNLKGGGAVPGLNRNDAYKKELFLPPLEIQKQIVEKIENEKKLVDSSKELIEIYEKKIKEKIESLWKK